MPSVTSTFINNFTTLFIHSKGPHHIIHRHLISSTFTTLLYFLFITALVIHTFILATCAHHQSSPKHPLPTFPMLTHDTLPHASPQQTSLTFPPLLGYPDKHPILLPSSPAINPSFKSFFFIPPHTQGLARALYR